MGWRAGCRVANMEFSQFHPTCLYHPKARSFLISEAVRGEGGRLVRPNGTRFIDDYDPRGGHDCVYLDISHQPAAFLQQHFPTIYAKCLELGIDITREPIPVVPATHYLRRRNNRSPWPNRSRKSLRSRRSGIHGSSRGESASFKFSTRMPCVRSGGRSRHRAAGCRRLRRRLRFQRGMRAGSPIPMKKWWSPTTGKNCGALCGTYVGIVRSTKRLKRAQHRVRLLLREIAEYYGSFRVTKDLIELRNLVVVAHLIVRSALARRESRGLHFHH